MSRIYGVNTSGKMGYTDNHGATWTMNTLNNADGRGLLWGADVRVPANKSPSGIDEEFQLVFRNGDSKLYKTTDLGVTIAQHGDSWSSNANHSMSLSSWYNLPDGRGIINITSAANEFQTGVFITKDGWYNRTPIYTGYHVRFASYTNDVVVVSYAETGTTPFLNKVFDWDGNLLYVDTESSMAILARDIWHNPTGDSYLYEVGFDKVTSLRGVRKTNLSTFQVDYQYPSSLHSYNGNVVSPKGLQIFGNTMLLSASTSSGFHLLASIDFGQSFFQVKSNTTRDYMFGYSSHQLTKYHDIVAEKALIASVDSSGNRHYEQVSKDSSGNYLSFTEVYDSIAKATLSDNSKLSSLPLIDIYALAKTLPSDILLSSVSLPESASPGTVVGTLTSNGDDVPLVYSLSGGLADNSAFSISGSDLVLIAALDYESKSLYSIEVSVTDASLNVFAKQFSIAVTNVNETPFGLSLSNSQIVENNSVGAVIGTLSATDPDGDALSFSITGGADSASFSVSGSQLLAAEAFDYESKQSYEIQVRASDAQGLHVEGMFYISILNSVIDDPIELSGNSDVIVLPSGKIVVVASSSPKVKELLRNGQPLAEGSVVRLSSDGKKFVKIAGDSLAYAEIPVSPKVTWGWSQQCDEAWAILQSI